LTDREYIPQLKAADKIEELDLGAAGMQFLPVSLS
jgi:hypothetical protein